MFNVFLQAGPKHRTIFTSKASKRPTFWLLCCSKSNFGFYPSCHFLFGCSGNAQALGDSLCQSFFFLQKYCRLNLGPNNLNNIPLNFLDEPLSSIMTNYGTWWYVTRTSTPVKGCGRRKSLEEIFLAKKKKRNFFLFISIRNCRWWNTLINHEAGFTQGPYSLETARRGRVAW